MKDDNSPRMEDPQEPPSATKPSDDGSEPEKPMAENPPGGEKEEEEAFLVSLYKFMKERHTPIERIPHLGFKQINLWKIYKAVEKLGDYELVTGRRLWKNVYDELGGSRGSTSAATCTRRHYERLLLPYVRHLKGEEDKPLPPSKPRKQYKVSKETGKKSRRSKKEKGREQAPPEKVTPEVTEDTRDTLEQGGCSSPAPPTSNPSEGAPGPSRIHSESYKRLFSSFYSKGAHPIMSPLAKKKLLAQVSEAESLHCHKRHCPEPPQRSPEPPAAPDPAPSAGSDVGPVTGTSPRTEEGDPAPTVFTGCFHACRSEGLQPGARHPLWGHFSSLRDFLEPPSTFSLPSEELEQPQDLRSKPGRSWSGENRPAATVTGCWVAPGAGFVPTAPRGKRGREEETAFGPGGKLRAISPLVTEADGSDTGAGSPRVAKPKAVVASPVYAAVLPQAPDGYKGAMLHFPASFGSPLEHLKTHGVPAAPSLSINPFIVPAFPSPLVATSELCRPLVTSPGRYPASYESSLRHRLYSTWHNQPAYSSPAFHHHTKL
ncbi:AT-rich interactive domain-containing protein 5A [Patagioenas fasciata monilis]|uniref:AT-rich interactive domain-containing protein 5A n=4 Tax=Columbidae TaxID=8930 RepID=A0A1V4KR37_PATFA|nr:AT-rich interactive domain-containing protein 5A [Patagioenas fasciata monilis]